MVKNTLFLLRRLQIESKFRSDRFYETMGVSKLSTYFNYFQSLKNGMF